jgi:flagellar assembly protein FliH
MRLSDEADPQAGAAYRPWRAPRMGASAAREREALADAEARARAEGFDAGLCEGREAGRAEVEARAEQLAAVLASLERPLQTVEEQTERALVEIACAVAGQLVRRELHAHPDEIVPVVREAVAALGTETQGLEIRLQPDDAALVREALSLGDDGERWRIREDPALARGDCQVHAGHAWVDARLDTRIARIVQHVLGGERTSDTREEGPR